MYDVGPLILIQYDWDYSSRCPVDGWVAATDAMDCCTQCANATWQAKGCLFWTFSGNACWFKTSKSGERANQDATSGAVNPAPPPSPPPPPAPPQPPGPPPPPPGPPSQPKAHSTTARPMSTGTVMLLVVALGLFLPYAIIGVTVQRRRGQSGADLIPHRDVWVNLGRLIGTGCSFSAGKVREKIGRRGASYEAL